MNRLIRDRSGSKCECVINTNGNRPELRPMTKIARRFVLLSLVFAIFAMLMAAAVADADRNTKSWRSGQFHICTFGKGPDCRISR